MSAQSFSKRQKDVIEGLFKGLSCKEIAQDMRVKPRTVKAHMLCISNKLGIDRKLFISRVRIVYLLSKGCEPISVQ